jgi:mannose-1-phosphate guanylyltransferase
MAQHLWGIILAGGDGRRLQPFIRDRLGSDRPKQYCPLIGDSSMLRQTISRAERVIPAERLLTVVNRSHLPFACEELWDREPETVIVQPCNRETGPGILLPLLHIHRRDPWAVVALLPSDHFVQEEELFMAAVETAAAFVTRGPRSLVLLGVEAERPEVEYGWIKTGAVVGQERGEELYEVESFWEKPAPEQAQVLYRKGWLWNTMVLVSRAAALLALFQALTPRLMAQFGQIMQVLGSPHEADVVEGVYATLPAVNFSQAILARSPALLAVLPVRGVYWSDWGSAEQIQLDLARL